MRVKIFQAWGHSQVAALEGKIDAFIAEIEAGGGSVDHTDLASCSTGMTGDEFAQTVTVAVWYKP